VSLATLPVPDAHENSKGVMSQDFDVLLHWHYGFAQAVFEGDLSSGGRILRRSEFAL
jgi:hypothetical protein